MDDSMSSSSSLRTSASKVALIRSVPAMPGAYPVAPARTRWPSGSPVTVGMDSEVSSGTKCGPAHGSGGRTIKVGIPRDGAVEVGGAGRARFWLPEDCV